MTAMLTRAHELNILDALLAALRSEVRAMCVGPTAAGPLTRLGIPASTPQRMRLAALARHIADELPAVHTRTVHAAGHRVEIRGSCALVDGEAKSLSRTSMAVLRALAQCPGAVLTRDELRHALPSPSVTPHAVESAVLRLRGALGDKNIVATVAKRGYRLAVDERVPAS